MSFASLLAFWIITFGSATEPAGNSDGIDPELHQMLVSRRDTLKEAAEIRQVRLQPAPSAAHMAGDLRILKDLLEVELELAQTKEERIAILDTSINSCRQMEDYLLAMQKAGLTGRNAEALLIKAERIASEIQRHRVQKGE
jgi:hypothetical protein